jgi:hypothetical protein
MSEHNKEEHNKDDKAAVKPHVLPFWKMFLSVFQASFGVQNHNNKQRDFETGSAKGFVFAALIFTLLFVLTLVIVVNLVLR